MFVSLIILCSHAMFYVTTARPIGRVRWWQRSWPKPSRQWARWPKQWCLPPAVAWRAPPAHYFHDVSQPAQRRLAGLRRPFSRLCSSSSIWRRRAHSVPSLHIQRTSHPDIQIKFASHNFTQYLQNVFTGHDLALKWSSAIRAYNTITWWCYSIKLVRTTIMVPKHVFWGSKLVLWMKAPITIGKVSL